MKYTWILMAVLFAVMTACSPAPTPTIDPQVVGTEVSRQLTAMPTNTAAPSPTEVPTEPPTPSPVPPTPTATSSPTPAPTATATDVPGDPRLTLGAPTWIDTFENGRAWGIYEDTHTRVEARNGRLELTALQADGWSGWTLSWPQIENAYIEATVRTGDCSGLDRFGLVFRASGSDQAYLYGFSCDGRYSLRLWDGESFSPVQDWAASPQIISGTDSVNRVGVMARGSRFGLYANGHLLAEVEDETFEDGTLGLFVAAVNTPGFTVRVREVAYWELP